MAYPAGTQQEERPDETSPPEPRARSESIPVVDVVLDPLSPGEAPRKGKSPHRAPSPDRVALYGVGAGLLLLAALFGVLIGTEKDRAHAFAHLLSRPPPLPSVAPVLPEATAKPSEVSAPAQSAEPDHAAPSQPPVLMPNLPIPGPWRVSQLGATPEIRLVEGTVERRSFIEALNDAGVPKAQVYRLLTAFSGVRKFDKTKRKDSFVAALELPSRRLRAFEYQITPTEIYQARQRDDGTLGAERLDLHVERKRAAGAVVMGDDTAASLQNAGFDPTLVDMLDDALEGRAQLSSLRAGSRLRIVLDYETALGVFAHYVDVLALEYLPADSDANPLRVYHLHDNKAEGYFDAKGHQPYKGGFRSPIPFARISSRFNLHRMHPILHVIKPHNGVDFAASSGTPVYAAANGTIEFMGDGGPSGNLITIRHGDGVTTGYCHLSRFAAHVARGQEVETRQLIGYVGSTGRSTGPHLHFSAKKNGVFIDPLTLKLDGDRVLPKAERDTFDEQRAAMDKLLDAIKLPPAEPSAHAKPDTIDGEDLEPLEEDAH